MEEIKTLAYWYFILNFVIIGIFFFWLIVHFFQILFTKLLNLFNRRKLRGDTWKLNERLNNLEDSRFKLEAQIEYVHERLTKLYETETPSKKSRRK